MSDRAGCASQNTNMYLTKVHSYKSSNICKYVEQKGIGMYVQQTLAWQKDWMPTCHPLLVLMTLPLHSELIFENG